MAGVNFGDTQGDVTIGGDVVGRDKIVNNIQNLYERTLTAVEAAAQESAFETKRLAQGVSAFVQRLQARASETADSGSPYKGLLEYRLSDADIFFGRDRAIRDLLTHLAGGPLTLLHAESGAGKTSLLQAGIAPRLIGAGHVPLYLRPYNVEPSLALKRAFISDPSQTPLLATAPLRDFLRQVSGVLGPQTRLYIQLDQFEEFFTQLTDPERDEFIRELAECVYDESLNVHWLLGLRTEYFGHLATFRPRIRNPFENDYRLNRLTRAEAQAVISQPAALRGLTFEDGLIEALLDDLGRTEIAPPQMQLVCSALFEELAPGETRLTFALYDREGRAAGILHNHLERVLSRDLAPPQRTAARRLLESLISSETQRVVRTHSELVAELTAKGVTPETLDVILNQLLENHLVRARESEVEGGELAYELAHDYLLGEIKLDPEVQARKAAQELLEQETRAYRRYQTLLAADRLQVIEPYLADLRLTPEAEQLLKESRAAVQREQQAEEARRQRELDDARKLAQETEARRQAEAERARLAEDSAARLGLRNRIITAVGVAAVALAIAAVFFGFRAAQNQALAEEQRQVAFARELAAAAISNLSIDSQRSLLLALQAVSATSQYQRVLPEAEDALHRAIQAARLQFTLTGHTDRVFGVAFSPDGTRLATASLDKTAKVWDAATGKELLTLTGHSDWVWDVAFSPDGTRLATGSSDRSAKIWEADTGRELFTLAGHNGEVLGIAFSPDGKLLATTGQDKTVKVWEADTGRELLTLSGHTEGVWDIAFSPKCFKPPQSADPCSYLLGTASVDKTAKLWRLTPASGSTGGSLTGKEWLTLSGHKDALLGIAFSPDGTRVATASQDKTAKIWDVITGKELLTLTGHTTGLRGVAFSPDGKHIATGSLDRTAKVWDIDSGRELLTLSGHAAEIVAVAFSPDGNRLATASQDATAKVWDVTPDHELFTLPENSHTGDIYDVAFSPDGKRIATASQDKTAKVWDATSGQWLLTLSGHTDEVFGVAFSPDGSRLATASLDKTATVWDAATGKELLTLMGHSDKVYSVAFSPDGKRLATASADKTAKVWDAATGKELFTLVGHEDKVYAVVFSPDGTRLATASWDGTGKVWEAATGNPIATLSGHLKLLTRVAFSPDGKRVATASQDGTAKVWDAASGKELLTLSGHNSNVFGVAFSPDGRRLATASFDKTVKVWDAASGLELLTLFGHTDRVYGVAFSPDGTRLATSSADRTARMYLLRIEDLVKLAQSRVTRPFTTAECQKYLHTEKCP